MAIIQSKWVSDGIIVANDGTIFKSFEMEPLSAGLFEENLEGPFADGFSQKLSELLSRLPNSFDGQIVIFRNRINHEISGLKTKILIFEKVKKEESYSHLQAILSELKLASMPLIESTWKFYLSNIFGDKVLKNSLPDVVWNNDSIKAEEIQFVLCH